MHWIDWVILCIFVVGLTALAMYMRQYTKSIADFLVANRAAGAFQVEVSAFTAGQFGLGSKITCHEMSFDPCLTRPADRARRASLAVFLMSLRRWAYCK